MRDRLTKLEALLPTLATKADLGDLKVELEKGHKENRAWMLATVIALFLGTLAVGNFLAAGLKESTKDSVPKETTVPQPIIIQLPAQTPPPLPSQAPTSPPSPPSPPKR